MSDSIKHECAVALLRLRKPQEYYAEKYGNGAYGFGKMALLLEKQHNRGQDGAGIASLRLSPRPGEPAFRIEKSAAPSDPLADLLSRCSGKSDFDGQLILGHLRYATFGRQDLSACHPFVHDSSRLRRILLIAGNYNLTNTAELFDKFTRSGHHPSSGADGYLLLETIANCMEDDETVHPDSTDWPSVLRNALREADGAYTLCGMNGAGDAFVIRDPHAIRPGYYYCDDEIFVAASERPAIQAAFDCQSEDVKEIPAGKALVVSRNGELSLHDCLEPAERRSCVFERIYFSRPNDTDIHHERKMLGKALAPKLLKAVGGDFDNTFFSYIPNSAQISFHGMLEELCHIAFTSGKLVRFGQIATKDAKFRTFIADAASRKELCMHVYDVTYGLVKRGTDTLVVLDDSIVRGSTMRTAILPILDRLAPKRIIVASSAPPIKYPDCYGIDMSIAGDLVAFQAAVEWLKKNDAYDIVQRACAHARRALAKNEPVNCMSEIYDAMPDSTLIEEIARLLTPPQLNSELEVVYTDIDELHACCPNHRGDWYFTGEYPTPGGMRMVNQSLVNFIENRTGRSY